MASTKKSKIIIEDNLNIILQKKYKENKILFIDRNNNVKHMEEIFLTKTEVQDFWGIK